jgi:glycosyltransferase involved in cell wall biosynthesis
VTRRALVSSYAPPAFDTDAGSRRLFDQISFLVDDGWAVEFVPTHRNGPIRYVRELRRRGVLVHDVSADVAQLAATAKFMLALFTFWQPAERLLPVVRAASPDTRIVVDSVDLSFLREARGVFAQESPAPGRLLDAEYGSHVQGELNVYAAADAVLTVSEREAALVETFLGDVTLLRSVPLCEDPRPATLPAGERQGILFVGSFHHLPNVSAVEWLCGEIVPRIHEGILERHPLAIVGAGIDDSIRRMAAGLEHVKMVGWVPSVEPYFERARLSVVPLLYGAGTKGKLIQALAAGTPTVTTSIGAEGLPVRGGEQILIADDAETFASAVAALATDDELWEHLARAGKEAVRQGHAREVARQLFHDAIAEVVDRSPKRAWLEPQRDELWQRRLRHFAVSGVAQTVLRSLRDMLAPGSKVAVVTDGSAALLRLGGVRTVHFPSDEEGRFLGRPESGQEALEALEAARRSGVEYVLIGHTEFWWLDRFPEFGKELARCDIVAGADTFRLYRIAAAPQAVASSDAEQLPETIAPRRPRRRAARPSVRLIAFYLPQFHPIPENDEWWGPGFTEWANVARAKPLFEGHYQPHLPADLGFYDLRLPEIRREQAELARAYGIDAFCYYHYWFSGSRLLGRPFEDVLRSGEPDFPFCLCWANEPWSRRWDGSDDDVLQPQAYSEEDDLAHIQWLLPALTDPRAVTVDGKPLFLVYQARALPDPRGTTDLWRREAQRAGLEGLHLVTVETGWDAGWDATAVGFDAKVGFTPQFSILRTTPRLPLGPETLHVFDYEQAWPALARPEPVLYRRYPCVFPSWDNTPRRGHDGWVVHHSTPQAYEAWLRDTIVAVQEEPDEHRLVFINAWNEWAESCHLEPDHRNGRAYLEATHRAADFRFAGRAGGQPIAQAEHPEPSWNTPDPTSEIPEMRV